MITYGILLLIMGIVLWGVGRLAAVPAFVVIVGEVLGAIGALLLIVGLILLVLPTEGIPVSSAPTVVP